MPRRAALAFLAFSAPAMLLAFAVGTPAGEVAFTLIAAAFPVALIALGVARGGSLGPLGWPLLALLTILVVDLVAILALRGSVETAPWLGGLPLPAAIMFYGLFLLPQILVCVAYVSTFERVGLSRDDLDALRRRFGREPAEKR